MLLAGRKIGWKGQGSGVIVVVIVVDDWRSILHSKLRLKIFSKDIWCSTFHVYIKIIIIIMIIIRRKSFCIKIKYNDLCRINRTKWIQSNSIALSISKLYEKSIVRKRKRKKKKDLIESLEIFSFFRLFSFSFFVSFSFQFNGFAWIFWYPVGNNYCKQFTMARKTFRTTWNFLML